MTDYLAINRANWDERAPMHAASADYGVESFLADPAHLSDVVRFDRARLGDLTGVRGVHLQCHIGTDTLSLSRLGAWMSGLDLSPASLAEARGLAERTGTTIDYHEAPVYDAVDVFGAGTFDLVYTGVGALCWLPDIARWGRTVAGLLRPGGRVFLREAHPMLMTLDETADPAWPRYPYFEHAEPLVFDEPETYVETDARLSNGVTHTWNHGLAETITALLDNGLTLTAFTEHDSAPWCALPGQMVRVADSEWRMRDEPRRLAASFTLEAVKHS
ncbi:class I SAM-dependent methyltransferase [Amycolatopsis samaneae]|uniref:Class I SAM-dependent methyltransferase n=1 Tax=Amycolatopsis samaneae TaxID=664691 RepID=A0ABW5G8P9_9PSEU